MLNIPRENSPVHSAGVTVKEKGGDLHMVAYEFYLRSDKGREHLVGILPERRRDSKRVTRESVMNWVRELLGNNHDSMKIFFVEVEV